MSPCLADSHICTQCRTESTNSIHVKGMHKNAFTPSLNQMSNRMDRLTNYNKQDIDSDTATETTCVLDCNTTQVFISGDSSGIFPSVL